ncbi:hypothetical protein JZ751_014356 [Albula glossodonta]|uniref:Ephrin RBD domain-containing protein n=1 Tax=Albula glossodonta TaxID=121402 RepID=A0A8T2NSN5_9TELE|nr:hypothetical protein JZ751_014356 [Albula glossodonta]
MEGEKGRERGRDSGPEQAQRACLRSRDGIRHTCPVWAAPPGSALELHRPLGRETEPALNREDTQAPGFRRGDYLVALSINDYLDIYCPYYQTALAYERMERYILFMVSYEGYRNYESGYNSPEPFLTDDSSDCNVALPCLVMATALMLTLSLS